MERKRETKMEERERKADLKRERWEGKRGTEIRKSERSGEEGGKEAREWEKATGGQKEGK